MINFISKVKIRTFCFVFFFSFFIFSLGTLSDYGINWDAVSHLSRGQAFLYYYISGEKNYSGLSNWNLYNKKEKEVKNETQTFPTRERLYFQKVDTIFFSPDIPKKEIPRISIYQNANIDLDETLKRYDYGHPHISDVLSSAFNFILFQKLGIINDVDSYRIYGVLLASILVGLVFWWTSNSFGKFAGVVAVLSLSLYPLFWSESHFNNEKDIPEAVYITFMIFSFWMGITSKSWKWILSSGIFFGLALGTKFNVLFSIFVILPWLIFYLNSKRTKEFSFLVFLKRYFKIILTVIVAPLLGIFIILETWPYFWADPVHKLSRIVDFYKTIGTTVTIDQGFIGPFGISTYAIQWILYATPLVILFMTFLGIVAIFSGRFQDKNKQLLLFLLMFFIPIVRVTWPGTNIYGGVRQIMEYIPPMAMISGIGGLWLRNLIAEKLVDFKIITKNQIFIVSFFIVILFVPITLKLIEIHPNENVYFNPLIGGLAGAKERDFPGWGVSFGAPYREAIDWINKNAEPGAKLTTGYEILSNIPGIFIRPDIEYKSNRSGYLREGEYVISLRFQGTDTRSYFDMYLDRMIEPIYQIKVDGVSILKIWKNDQAHLKDEWRKEEVIENLSFTKIDKRIAFDIGKQVKLSRLELDYRDTKCKELDSGYLMVSKDDKLWERIPGVLPEEVRIKTLGIQPANGKFIEPFAGQEARYINFYVSPKDTCVTQIEQVKLHYFP